MMSWFDGVRHRIRTLVNPSAYDEELDEEMRHHIALDEMQQHDGLRARRRFGNRTYYKEETRRMTWLGTIDVLGQDLGYIWRTIRRSPGLTITIVVTLALGIGVNAAVFSVIDRLYLRAPGGIRDPSSLRRYWIEHFNRSGGPLTAPHMTYPMFRTIADASSDSNVAVFTGSSRMRQGRHPLDPELRGSYASARFFPLLGVRPALGRFYSPEEDRLGDGTPVVVVSHDFWTTRLGGDPAIIGQPLAIRSRTFTIIGVANRGFTGLDMEPTDVWLPISMYPPPAWLGGSPWWQSQNIYAFRAVQRLAASDVESAIAQRATTRIRALNRQLTPQRPDTQMNVFIGSIIEARGPGTPRQEQVIASRLGAVAAIVLLIVCANVINLLLARAVRRHREIAVRLALGISRARLVRLLTTETLVLAAFAGIAALVAAAWGGELLRSLLMPNIEWTNPAVDWRVAAFTVVITLAAGLVAGVIPAVQASKSQLSTTRKSGWTQTVTQRSRLRRGLTVMQAAFSLVLLAGAALFVQSLRNVQSLDIGFDAGRLLFGQVRFAIGEAPPGPVIGATMRDIAERLAQRPGVEAVARTSIPPMRGFGIVAFFTRTDSIDSFRANPPTMSVVSPNFFQATGIRLLRGTTFTGADIDGAPAELVVNDAAAKLLWPDEEPVGQCVTFEKRGNPCYTVTGIVENARQRQVLEQVTYPQFYLPLGNTPASGWDGTTLVVRARPGAVDAAAVELGSALRNAFPAAAATITPMSENLEPEYRPWQLGATLFTVFGALALLVTVIGVFSTVSYDVSQRTREFGVRVALGARTADVLRQVIGDGVRTVLLGIALGVCIALASGKLIAALLYDISPNEPTVLLMAAISLVVVAGIATLPPAWRAGRADPMVAMRAD